jgi:hypothetical protein
LKEFLTFFFTHHDGTRQWKVRVAAVDHILAQAALLLLILLRIIVQKEVTAFTAQSGTLR